MNASLKASTKDYDIWLCDLTHSYQTIATNCMPLNVGVLATYFMRYSGHPARFKLFKYAHKVREACANGPVPVVAGFANVVMNQNLNLAVAERLKRLYPHIAIIFGGANFPLEEEGRYQFLKKNRCVDFYVFFEGEIAFREIVDRLIEHDFDVGEVKKSRIGNTVSLLGDDLLVGDSLPRINLAETDSPYLAGLMDEFFEDFKPLVEFDRGCPFSCSFCSMSTEQWSKVSRRRVEDVAKELDYIARRVNKGVELVTADSNFGMYQHSIEYSRELAKIQDRYNWPNYITVATGKNIPHRVIESSKILRGAPITTVAVQSTDDEVLKNIKRSNIKTDRMLEFAKEAVKVSTSLVYSDVIVALPGDSVRAHLKSIRDVMGIGLETVITHTLALLDGTDLAKKEEREKYRMQSRFRVMPRCFGKYEWLKGEEFVAAEIDEVCIANSTMSFEDYQECRLFHLTMELFFNDKILHELYEIMNHFKVHPFDFLYKIHELAPHSDLRNLYGKFKEDIVKELWENEEELIRFTKIPGNIEKFKSGEFGKNLITSNKCDALLNHFDDILDVAFDAAERVIGEKLKGENRLPEQEPVFRFLSQMKKFIFFKKGHFLDKDKYYEGGFDYNFERLDDYFSNGFAPNGRQTFKFCHDDQQKEMIDYQKRKVGESLASLSKIVAQVSIKKFFRTPQAAGMR